MANILEVATAEFADKGLAGARIEELPITFADREHGASKMGLPIVFEAIGIVPWLRWNRPDVGRIRTRARIGRGA